MGNSQHFRTFNTLRHSNRKARKKRLEQSRILLLSGCVVIIAILLCLAVLIFCSIAHTVKENAEKKKQEQIPTVVLEYETKTVENATVGEGFLIVVNEINHCRYTYPDITLTNLQNIREAQQAQNPYQVSSDVKMEQTAAEAANRMLTAYFNATKDQSLKLFDAYRTKDQQSRKTVSVGYSEHETGYLFNLEVASTEQELTEGTSETYQWIYDHCAEYGIVMRYPRDKTDKTGVSDYEEGFRYVGIPHATYMTEKKLCLEEYVELLAKDYAGDTHLRFRGADEKDYEVYYVSKAEGTSTEVKVPKDYEYTVSGDNIGGFIVTVCLTK